jgi:5-hydroxyisourate hydrolase-like protein (transthyretin family)
MTGKMTVTVRDDVNHQNAQGIEYDLWRVNQSTDRVKIKHGRITDANPHLLVQANTPDDLGSFEIVLFVKDYFESTNQNLNMENSRLVIPFGFNEINRDYHLGICITPTGFTCTL